VLPRILTALLLLHAALGLADGVHALIERTLVGGARSLEARAAIEASVERSALLGIMILVALAITAPVFLAFFDRAYGELPEPRRRRSWVLVAWLVPLFLPRALSMTREICAHHLGATSRLPWPVFGWWTAWLMTLALALLQSLVDARATSLDEFRDAIALRAAASFCAALAALLLVLGFVRPVASATDRAHA